MKAVKKYLAVMITIFMIASVCPAAVYASPEEGDVAEEILVAEEAAPVPELDEETGPESVETIDDASEVEAEAVIPEEPSGLEPGESSEEAPGLTAVESSEAAVDEIEEEVPEEIVGASVQVGEDVTATFDSDTGAVVFNSKGGTLWKDWISKSGFKSGEIKSISSNGKLYLPADSGFLFQELNNLVDLDTSNFITSKVTNMQYMFYNCRSLTSLDLDEFDTSKVTTMIAMFASCQNLTCLDLGSFNTSSLTDIGAMFANCLNLRTLVLTNFDLSNVTSGNAVNVFRNCNALRLLGTQKKTSCIINLPVTLYNRAGIEHTAIPVSSASLILAKDKELAKGSLIVGDCVTGKFTSSTGALSLYSDEGTLWNGWKEVPGIDKSKIKSIGVSHGTVYLPSDSSAMFQNCISLTNLDLSSFDTSNVTNMSGMFYNCTNLEVLRTPKKHTATGVTLPLTMYDTAGKKYTELPVLSKSIVLGKTQKIAHEYAAKPISECTITLKPNSYTYDGKTKKPAVTVKDGTKTLTSGTDYTAAYSKNKNAGTAVVTITATETGNYKGTKTVNFTIKKAAAGLAFAESSITKRSTDAPFTNPLTKATTTAATFTSDNTAVATVDSATGEVTLKGVGTATITAEAKAATNYNAGTATFTLTVEKPANGFSDVQDLSHPFYNAIYWAADAGITKGYPDGTFGIDRNCTRGEMMMFLWRYVGKPAPTMASTSPFKDVPTTHAFYKAILWGSQKGITKGYPDGTFGIDRNVSRGECMMFLWRLKGKPAPAPAASSPVKDVPKTHAFYNAILWGAQKGITKGYTSGPKVGNFGINDNCLRGQIVTFLYRAKSI